MSRALLFGFLVAVLAFVILPLAIVVVNSFSSVAHGEWPPPGLSTRWYERLFEQDAFGAAAVRSLGIAAIATAVSVVVGTAAALALVRHRFPGRRLADSLLLAPVIVPKVAIGFAAFIFFTRIEFYGGFDRLVLAHIVITLPFVVTVVGAALVRVDRTQEEAAMDLGATPWQAFRLTTLPQIRPGLIAATLFSLIVSFDEVDASIFLADPGAETLPIAMYTYVQKYQDPTLAALSTLLIAGSFVLAAAVAVLAGRTGVIRTVASRHSGGSA